MMSISVQLLNAKLARAEESRVGPLGPPKAQVNLWIAEGSAQIYRCTESPYLQAETRGKMRKYIDEAAFFFGGGSLPWQREHRSPCCPAGGSDTCFNLVFLKPSGKRMKQLWLRLRNSCLYFYPARKKKEGQMGNKSTRPATLWCFPLPAGGTARLGLLLPGLGPLQAAINAEAETQRKEDETGEVVCSSKRKCATPKGGARRNRANPCLGTPNGVMRSKGAKSRPRGRFSRGFGTSGPLPGSLFIVICLAVMQNGVKLVQTRS